ncbi:nuclear transport factor 2 family protein [Terrimonas sp. NA20]|uniref:Nuclear transport factor 2 family protein n=1 Tax=Terrimonas ginsenosidimutans TaxID=2908004 RepID=A0ABS9KWA7_9BACT|nr:nuclear transport factor 2 family protein [Terrimonas ginsenosidimutans]MCG2616590.1 nuclear transport factor 2 family protein [Terrimonas ginsenosidimutans]
MNSIKIFTTAFIFLCGLTVKAQQQASAGKASYVPDDRTLFNTIVRMDSIFFDAYNKCNVDLQTAIYADSLEFYHDKGGYSTSKADVLAATKRNICDKVTRTVVPGSIEVYPIAGFGAIEIGLHRFFNKQEPDAPQHDSKFIIIWKQTGSDWKITRVISLH